MHHCAESIFKVDYLREYESIFENALAHESVDPGVLFDAKTRGRKSLEAVSLTTIKPASDFRLLGTKTAVSMIIDH
jgi:hypothetical protein